jgi:hypothetical protein
MAATITAITAPQNPDVTEREALVDGTIALTGNYGGAATHGDTLNLTQLQDLAKSSQLPTKVEIWEDPPAGTVPTGFEFVFCPGTTQANGVLCILGTGAAAGGPAQEYTEASAYSAALLAAVLRIRAWFPSY